jgi:hypothetical protein
MKRRWWIVIGVTACSVIALITTLSIFCKDPIAQNADKIKGGMSEEDVIRLFGREADQINWTASVSSLSRQDEDMPNANAVNQTRKTWHGNGVDFSGTFVGGRLNADSIRIEKTETFMEKHVRVLSPSEPSPRPTPVVIMPPITFPGSGETPNIPD